VIPNKKAKGALSYYMTIGEAYMLYWKYSDIGLMPGLPLIDNRTEQEFKDSVFYDFMTILLEVESGMDVSVPDHHLAYKIINHWDVNFFDETKARADTRASTRPLEGKKRAQQLTAKRAKELVAKRRAARPSAAPPVSMSFDSVPPVSMSFDSGPKANSPGSVTSSSAYPNKGGTTRNKKTKNINKKRKNTRNKNKNNKKQSKKKYHKKKKTRRR
jgi:hypothetical protein